MRFDVLTIFPELFGPFFETSLIGKAREGGLIDARVHDLRDFADDKHKTVDDTPYGGGAGMVMKVEPIDRALRALARDSRLVIRDSERPESPITNHNSRIAVLSARGAQFDQRKAEEYAKLDQLILICGRYEGIDQRVADYLADEEISIGPYVLNGGEAAAMVVLEAVSRLVPGVLGNPESLAEESFTANHESRITNHEAVEYPQYTKPAEYKGWKVPEVLLGGNHEEIKKWRRDNSGVG